MKTKNVVVSLCLILAIGSSVSLQAQENLDALREKAKKEKLSLSERQVINQNGQETINEKITIINNKKMVDEFMDAFDKDSKKASKSMTRKKDQMILKDLIIDSDSCLIRYNMQADDEANAIINYMKKKGSINEPGHKRSIEKREKERALREREREKVLKNREKERTLREKEREKVIKEREKERAKREKEREKAIKEREKKRASKTEEKIKDKKMKFMIPKGSYMTINGEKVTAEQARKLGYDVEEF